jgi:hypothetical protein
MALTAKEHQALIDAGLTNFFEKHKALYKSIANDCYIFAQKAVEAAGLPVRVDDVIKVVLPALEIEPTLRDYLAGEKLTQQYWIKRFGNYILDQVWRELTNAVKASHRS